ncbi:hypothetical protein CWO29_06120 [Vibrio splendidus]|nr:hypothetical protein CWO29_06120 [Vibrio splendidus]
MLILSKTLIYNAWVIVEDISGELIHERGRYGFFLFLAELSLTHKCQKNELAPTLYSTYKQKGLAMRGL